MARYFLLCCILFSCVRGFSQHEGVKKTREVIGLLPEKILIHSDKDFYISGELMWYKVYVVNAQSLKPQSFSKTAYAELLGKDGAIAFQTKIQLSNGMGSGSFMIPDSIHSGVYELRVYTNWMKNRPDAVSHKNISIVNTLSVFDTSSFRIIADDGEFTGTRPHLPEKDTDAFGVVQSYKQEIQLQLDKESYKQRSPVNLRVTSLLSNTDADANLSVAVFKLNKLTRRGIRTEIIPSGEIPRKEAGENGRRIYLPEMNGHIVSIKAVNTSDGSAAENVPLIISLTGKLTCVKYGETDEWGIASFDFQDVYGPAQLFLKTTPEFENIVDLQVLSPFLRYREYASVKGILSETDLDAIEEMHNNLAVTRAFGSMEDSENIYFPENADSLSFYGKPYKTYLLDDYRRFVTMEEVLREYVMEVNVRIRKNDYFLPVLNRQNFELSRYILVEHMMDEDGPLILIDGIPVTANVLMKYNPLKIRKLDVVADKYWVGKKSYDGILSFTTFRGKFEELQLGNKELLADDQGWQYQRKFLMPDYSNLNVKNSRLPDFRELLLWEPELQINAKHPGNVSFFTSDLTGEFIVVVKGVSGGGELIYNTLRFSVEK